MRKSQPKISIITPSFNQGQFIEDAIASVQQQNYANYEHIIIDNCSTDNTLSVLKKHSTLTWISEPDKGQSNALNKGFQMARGEILGWLNADDSYLPEIFPLVVEAFEKYPDADIIYGNWNFVDVNGKLIKRFQSLPFNQTAILYYGPYVGSTALFFKREIIEEGILINEKFRYTMDWEWYAHLGYLGKKFKFINHTLANFRLHGSNQSQKYLKMSDMERIFNRAQQLAEGYAIKRCYGYRFCKGDSGSLFEEFSFRTLWWTFRVYTILQKLFYLLRYNPDQVKNYAQKRKIELEV